MNAFIGNFSLAIAMTLSLTLSVLPFLLPSKTGQSPALPHTNTNIPKLMRNYSRSLAGGVLFFLVLSLLALMTAFVTDDFSLEYVAANSGKTLPLVFKISAIWGAHEGSMLLWCLILSGWFFVFANLRQKDPANAPGFHITVLALASAFLSLFLAFVLFLSNPFGSVFPPPSEGNYLNPLLQDFAFIMHPPLLYMGYAGLALICAIALATSLHNLPPRESGRLLINWARNSWAFLTIGIGLGSWWAYYELGWGGWWFWDPVENSSLMPWLALAALVHSAAALRKRQQLQGWVLFLALLCLSLSLMGIFLVRSGLLTSVHAFALDKERGLFLLAIWLLCTLAGCIILYLGYKRERKKISPGSRTFVLLLNNLLLLSALFCVFVGTYYPLLADWLYGRPISVGAPYFAQVITPLALVGGCIAAFVALFSWNGENGANEENKRNEGEGKEENKRGSDGRTKATTPGNSGNPNNSNNEYARKNILPVKKLSGFFLICVCMILFSAGVALAFPHLYAGSVNLGASLFIFVGVLLLCGTLAEVRNLVKPPGQGASASGEKSKKNSLKRKGRKRLWSILPGHLGFVLLILGTGLNGIYHQKVRIIAQPGEKFEQFGYEWTLKNIESGRKDNYEYMRAQLIATDPKNGKEIQLLPARHLYDIRQQVTAESAIHPGVFADIVATFSPDFTGSPNRNKGHLFVLQWQPFVRWVWAGGIFIALGAWLGWLGEWESRRHKKRKEHHKKREEHHKDLPVASQTAALISTGIGTGTSAR